MQDTYGRSMSMFGGLMNDTYRRYNEQSHGIDLAAIDKQIAEAERLADQERSREIADGALQNLTKDGSKAAKAIAADLQRALQSIRI